MQTNTDDTDMLNRKKDKYKQYFAYLRKKIDEVERKYYEHTLCLDKDGIKSTWKIQN